MLGGAGYFGIVGALLRAVALYLPRATADLTAPRVDLASSTMPVGALT